MARNGPEGIGLASLVGLRGDAERAGWPSELWSQEEGRNGIQGSGSCLSKGREVARGLSLSSRDGAKKRAGWRETGL